MHPVWRYTWQSSARQDRTKIIPAGEQDCLSFDGQQPDSWGHFQSNAIWSRAVPARLWGISCHQWSRSTKLCLRWGLTSYTRNMKLLETTKSCWLLQWGTTDSAKTLLSSSLLVLWYQEVQWKHLSACCLLPVQEIPVPPLQELLCLSRFLSASLNVVMTYRNLKKRCWEMSLHPMTALDTSSDLLFWQLWLYIKCKRWHLASLVREQVIFNICFHELCG